MEEEFDFILSIHTDPAIHTHPLLTESSTSQDSNTLELVQSRATVLVDEVGDRVAGDGSAALAAWAFIILRASSGDNVLQGTQNILKRLPIQREYSSGLGLNSNSRVTRLVLKQGLLAKVGADTAGRIGLQRVHRSLLLRGEYDATWRKISGGIKAVLMSVLERKHWS
jgi:hypothetical protein